MPKWLLPSRLLSKQRLTASCPDAKLVTEIPTKRRIVPDTHPRYALTSRAALFFSGEGAFLPSGPFS